MQSGCAQELRRLERLDGSIAFLADRAEANFALHGVPPGPFLSSPEAEAATFLLLMGEGIAHRHLS